MVNSDGERKVPVVGRREGKRREREERGRREGYPGWGGCT